MICGRCHSAMVLETFVDLASGGNPGAFLGWRCVTCGSIVDPVIAEHRHFRPPPSLVRPKGHHKRTKRPIDESNAFSD